jgi:hypothetical protein
MDEGSLLVDEGSIFVNEGSILVNQAPLLLGERRGAFSELSRCATARSPLCPHRQTAYRDRQSVTASPRHPIPPPVPMPREATRIIMELDLRAIALLHSLAPITFT